MRLSPAADLALQTLDVLGLSTEPEAARLVLAMWARPVRRLSRAEAIEVMSAIERMSGRGHGRSADISGREHGRSADMSGRGHGEWTYDRSDMSADMSGPGIPRSRPPLRDNLEPGEDIL